MIERKILASQLKTHLVDEYMKKNVKGSDYSHTEIIKTPLGEKVVVFSSRPGLVIGRKGSNIKRMTADMKDEFGLNNPQLEISEVNNPLMNAEVVAGRIVSALERFGSARFKGVMHKVMSDVMGANALGIEVAVSGKVPSSRARTWKINAGYMKKNGDVAVTGVSRAKIQAFLKTGVVGVQVRIMPKGLVLPDHIEINEEDLTNYDKEEVVEVVEEAAKKETTKKK